jgi:hypothetical protein
MLFIYIKKNRISFFEVSELEFDIKWTNVGNFYFTHTLFFRASRSLNAAVSLQLNKMLGAEQAKKKNTCVPLTLLV